MAVKAQTEDDFSIINAMGTKEIQIDINDVFFEKMKFFAAGKFSSRFFSGARRGIFVPGHFHPGRRDEEVRQKFHKYFRFVS